LGYPQPGRLFDRETAKFVGWMKKSKDKMADCWSVESIYPQRQGQCRKMVQRCGFMWINGLANFRSEREPCQLKLHQPRFVVD
jgi:hypothetical protein